MGQAQKQKQIYYYYYYIKVKNTNTREMAPIAVGNVIPDGSLSYFDDKDDLQSVSVHSLAAGKKVILFGVPGAFTPTCSLKHVPGFIERAEELKSKGVDDMLLVLSLTLETKDLALVQGDLLFCSMISK